MSVNMHQKSPSRRAHPPSLATQTAPRRTSFFPGMLGAVQSALQGQLKLDTKADSLTEPALPQAHRKASAAANESRRLFPLKTSMYYPEKDEDGSQIAEAGASDAGIRRSGVEESGIRSDSSSAPTEPPQIPGSVVHKPDDPVVMKAPAVVRGGSSRPNEPSGPKSAPPRPGTGGPGASIFGKYKSSGIFDAKADTTPGAPVIKASSSNRSNRETRSVKISGNRAASMSIDTVLNMVPVEPGSPVRSDPGALFSKEVPFGPRDPPLPAALPQQQAISGIVSKSSLVSKSSAGEQSDATAEELGTAGFRSMIRIPPHKNWWSADDALYSKDSNEVVSPQLKRRKEAKSNSKDHHVLKSGSKKNSPPPSLSRVLAKSDLRRSPTEIRSLGRGGRSSARQSKSLDVRISNLFLTGGLRKEATVVVEGPQAHQPLIVDGQPVTTSPGLKTGGIPVPVLDLKGGFLDPSPQKRVQRAVGIVEAPRLSLLSGGGAGTGNVVVGGISTEQGQGGEQRTEGFFGGGDFHSPGGGAVLSAIDHDPDVYTAGAVVSEVLSPAKSRSRSPPGVRLLMSSDARRLFLNPAGQTYLSGRSSPHTRRVPLAVRGSTPPRPQPFGLLLPKPQINIVPPAERRARQQQFGLVAPAQEINQDVETPAPLPAPTSPIPLADDEPDPPVRRAGFSPPPSGDQLSLSGTRIRARHASPAQRVLMHATGLGIPGTAAPRGFGLTASTQIGAFAVQRQKSAPVLAAGRRTGVGGFSGGPLGGGSSFTTTPLKSSGAKLLNVGDAGAFPNTASVVVLPGIRLGEGTASARAAQARGEG